MPTNNKDWAGNVERLFKVKQRRDVQGGGGLFDWVNNIPIVGYLKKATFGPATISMKDVFNNYKMYMIDTYITKAKNIIRKENQADYYKDVYTKIYGSVPIREMTPDNITAAVQLQLDKKYKIPDTLTVKTWIDLFTNFSFEFVPIYNLYLEAQSKPGRSLAGGVCELEATVGSNLDKDCTIAVVNGFVTSFSSDRIPIEKLIYSKWLLPTDIPFDVDSITNHLTKFISDILLRNYIKSKLSPPIQRPKKSIIELYAEAPFEDVTKPAPEVLAELRRHELASIKTPEELRMEKTAAIEKKVKRTAPLSLPEKAAQEAIQQPTTLPVSPEAAAAMREKQRAQEEERIAAEPVKLIPIRNAPLPPTDRPALPVREEPLKRTEQTTQTVDKIVRDILKKDLIMATPEEVLMVKYALAQAQRESVNAKNKGEREWTPDDVYNRTGLKTEGPTIGFPNSYNPYSTTPVAAGGGSRVPNSLYHHKYMKYKSKYLNLKS